ncbi:MAG: HTH domain-containing protein [Agitococcus sp.]|jgi:predicted transcriptional regulator|nr:HTH domain-containing protein [Agitococcus sp.]HQV80994.1 MarR family transcriptional regulator [Agitococcus sp.]
MKKLIVRTESLDDFLARAKDVARRADAGSQLEHSITISFNDVVEMASVLTKERIRMLQALLGVEKTVSELALELHRNQQAVARDVKQLESRGLLFAKLVSNPGHGRHKVVRTAAPRIELSAVIEANTIAA